MNKERVQEYIPKAEFQRRRQGIKKGTLEQWLFFRDSNGLAKYVRKVGKTVFIDDLGFDEWIDQYGKQA